MASSGSPTAAPRTVRALEYVAGALILAYVIWTVPGVRPSPAIDVARDSVLHGAGYVMVAVLAVTWAVQRSVDPARAPVTPATWCLVAGIGLRALGFVLTLTFRSLGEPLPYPSVADVAWVLSSLVIIAAVVLRLRTLAPRLTTLVALDALAASLVLVGLVVGILSGPVRTLGEAPGAEAGALVTNIVYPIIDAALLVALAALVAAGRARLVLSDLLVVVSVVASVVVDVVFFVLLSEGLWRPGTLLASLSLVSTAVLAVAVRTAPGRAPTGARRLLGETPAPTPRPGPAVPATYVAISLIGLTVSSLAGAPLVTVLCFGLTGVVAVVRGVRTFSVERDVVDVALGAATTDLRQFQALVEASTDLIGMSDSAGNIFYLNPGGRRLLRMPGDRDVRSLTVAEVVPGAGEASFSKRWPLLLERGLWEGESELHPLDGSDPVPVAISTFVMYDPETHRPFALATIQRDIRDIRRQEAALRDIADQRARLLNRLVQAQEAERSPDRGRRARRLRAGAGGGGPAHGGAASAHRPDGTGAARHRRRRPAGSVRGHRPLASPPLRPGVPGPRGRPPLSADHRGRGGLRRHRRRVAGDRRGGPRARGRRAHHGLPGRHGGDGQRPQARRAPVV